MKTQKQNIIVQEITPLNCCFFFLYKVFGCRGILQDEISWEQEQTN